MTMQSLNGKIIQKPLTSHIQRIRDIFIDALYKSTFYLLTCTYLLTYLLTCSLTL